VGWSFLALLTPQKPRRAVPTVREVEAAGTISDVDVDLQLLWESAGGESLTNVTVPNVALPDARLDC